MIYFISKFYITTYINTFNRPDDQGEQGHLLQKPWSEAAKLPNNK